MGKWTRAWIIAGMALATTVAHYLTPHHLSNWHEFLQRFYYVPVVLGGIWFGMRGGLITALLISVAYFPHAFHGWHGPSSFFFRISEMVMYHVVGGLTGYLAGRVSKALAAETDARRERETAYEDLRRKTEELFTLEEQLRRSDRLAALGRLSAGLAHEIRNPLGSIRTSAEILRDRQRDAAHPEGEPDFLQVITEETERLNRIVSGFLEFTRQEKRQPGAEPETSDLGHEVAKTADLLASGLSKRGIRIDSAVPTDLVVGIPPSQLRQVLLNLFLNSQDAVGDGGRISVRAEKQGLVACVTLSDSGPGITAENVDRVFDPFFTTKDRGTGLGLSIVERIVAGNGGSIRLDRSQMPTSTFLIELPAVA